MELFFSSSLHSLTVFMFKCFRQQSNYCAAFTVFLEVFHVIPCCLCHHFLGNVGYTRIPSNSLGQSPFTNREDSLMKCSCK